MLLGADSSISPLLRSGLIASIDEELIDFEDANEFIPILEEKGQLGLYVEYLVADYLFTNVGGFLGKRVASLFKNQITNCWTIHKSTVS